MPDNPLASRIYQELVAEIVSLYEGVRRGLIEAYWTTGRRIVEVEQRGEIRAAYGSQLIQKLSEELTEKLGSGFSDSQLQDMRRFYLANPKSRPVGELGWSQHILLSRIENVQKRKALEQKAIREGLKRDELRSLVRAECVREQIAKNLARNTPNAGSAKPPELLTPVRGELWTYRMIRPRLVAAEDSELLIDLGFSCTVDLDNITERKLDPGVRVVSSRDARGNYSLAVHQGVPGDLYTYLAEVEKVVDGDTLKVIVDLGFGFKTRQSLRLRGIDCPEIDTPEGKKAAEFVRSKIRQSDRIILSSSKSDKYDRYLADVYFAVPEKGEEVFLNNLLLEQGWAVRMKG